MPVPSWRTPKALYRMARRGGDPWTRVRDSFPPEQREELSRLNETVDALSAELKEARDVEEQKSSTISDRRRLRKPWEEARRTALEPSESFVVATGVVDILQSAPTRRLRPAELAEELDADPNADDFLEAVQTVV